MLTLDKKILTIFDPGSIVSHQGGVARGKAPAMGKGRGGASVGGCQGSRKIGGSLSWSTASSTL